MLAQYSSASSVLNADRLLAWHGLRRLKVLRQLRVLAQKECAFATVNLEACVANIVIPSFIMISAEASQVGDTKGVHPLLSV